MWPHKWAKQGSLSSIPDSLIIILQEAHLITFSVSFLKAAKSKRTARRQQDAYSGEIGRLFGLKTAGCSGKSATLLVAPD